MRRTYCCKYCAKFEWDIIATPSVARLCLEVATSRGYAADSKSTGEAKNTYERSEYLILRDSSSERSEVLSRFCERSEQKNLSRAATVNYRPPLPVAGSCALT